MESARCHLQNGNGAVPDDAEAVMWYWKSAAQNNQRAQINLAWMYRNGRGMPKNVDEAIKLYRQAAAGPNPEFARLARENLTTISFVH